MFGLISEMQAWFAISSEPVKFMCACGENSNLEVFCLGQLQEQNFLRNWLCLRHSSVPLFPPKQLLCEDWDFENHAELAWLSS